MERIPENEASSRSASMQRNPALERLLAELNAALPAAQAALAVDVGDKRAKLFLLGPMRSGTTLYMQWLASTGLTAYPSNLLSRFYGAPLVGAKLQQLLTDPTYSFRNEILDFNAEPDFHSENGKTTGALAPNEFWYFWRRFLPGLANGYCSDDVLRITSDLRGLRDEVSGLSNIFDKPFVMKALILNQHAHLLAEIFARPLLVWIRRDPAFNIQSVLNARLRQYGNIETWYSFKIREYPQLQSLDPLHAVAGQIHAINSGLARTFAELPRENRLVVHYEEFCRDPSKAFSGLVQRLEALGETAPASSYTGPARFSDTNIWTFPHYSRADAERAYADMAARMGGGDRPAPSSPT